MTVIPRPFLRLYLLERYLPHVGGGALDAAREAEQWIIEGEQPLSSATAESGTAIGAPFAGGFLVDRIVEDGKTFALVVAPKDGGERSSITWKDAAAWCESLRIGGSANWHLPTKDELALVAKAFLPGTTEIEAFKAGGTEAFAREWYWTSTEFSTACAWFQAFSYGTQLGCVKDDRVRCRAVRKVLI